MSDETRWVEVPLPSIPPASVTTVNVADRAVCVVHLADGTWSALDNRCPHQGGPLGQGTLEDGYLICPWHGYQYDPVTGRPPPGFRDVATPRAVRTTGAGLEIELPVERRVVSLMDQMVDVLCDWGLDACFGMVGHSNLGMADALRIAADDGRLTFVGIRHEGAAAFAASGYAKLTGRPAACFSIAGPGATNLMTGLWDAKVDRVPIVALTGQVNSQVLGPGTFQEVPLAQAFEPVAEWTQTVLTPANATDLAALAMKHAIVQRDVAHLVLPDEVQELPGLAEPPARARHGRVAATGIGPPTVELAEAFALLADAERPVIVAGNGARSHRDELVRLAEHLDAPVVTTFKAKGIIGDDHPLGCGVLGRSGIPVASSITSTADCLVVLGASFSNHTSIPTWVPTIQVDLDPMILGKFHPVTVPLWSDIARFVGLVVDGVRRADRPDRRAEVATRWAAWRAEKARRRTPEPGGPIHPATVFEALGQVAPDDAIFAVDVGNNTYSFGRYFESAARQDVIMSGYLGSIGFALPAAIGAAVAVRRDPALAGRKVVAVCGDGGLGQYLAEITTAVKYELPITVVVLDNGQLAKISAEQRGAHRPVWQTSLVNPDFAAYADLCGATGIRVDDPDQLTDALATALAVTDRPTLVAIRTSDTDV